MRRETQDALLKGIGFALGLVAVVVWAVIDPFVFILGSLVSIAVIAMDRRPLRSKVNAPRRSVAGVLQSRTAA